MNTSSIRLGFSLPPPPSQFCDRLSRSTLSVQIPEPKLSDSANPNLFLPFLSEEMSSSNGGGAVEAAGPRQSPTPESSALFGEGISLVLSRWFALQVAIENQWGDGDSRQKSHDLASAIFSWFSQSKESLYIDDLEAILDESMVDLFSTEVEDGSIEEVAEQLMVMHEDCLKGNYESIEMLRKSVPVTNVVSRSRLVINDDEDESSDEEGSGMMVDEQQPEMAVDNPTRDDIPNKPNGPDEEGWTVVAPKRNKGRKSR